MFVGVLLVGLFTGYLQTVMFMTRFRVMFTCCCRRHRRRHHGRRCRHRSQHASDRIRLKRVVITSRDNNKSPRGLCKYDDVRVIQTLTGRLYRIIASGS